MYSKAPALTGNPARLNSAAIASQQVAQSGKSLNFGAVNDRRRPTAVSLS